MDDPVSILRMVERLTAVLIGGFSIWLGYRLFFHLPFDKDQEGQLVLPGVKIVLSRVGPGVFFAAFGTAVLFYSLANKVEVVNHADGGQTAPGGGVFSGMGPTSEAPSHQPSTPTSGNATPQQRARALTTIELLNCAAQVLDKSVDDTNLRSQLVVAIRDAKRALLLSVWDSRQWGSPDEMAGVGQENEAPLEIRAILNGHYGGCNP